MNWGDWTEGFHLSRVFIPALIWELVLRESPGRRVAQYKMFLRIFLIFMDFMMFFPSQARGVFLAQWTGSLVFRAQSSGLPTERQALSRLRIRGKEHVGYSGSPEARSARRLGFLATEKGSRNGETGESKDRNDARKKHCSYIRGISWWIIVYVSLCI